ncbi:four helix bundle protein [Billgrantia desiderata]|uniref:four helix bundle protein n=1 Tax=Billgrantia desiderata TaxID=52021 RepID=UPI001F297BDB|nr:four helix bundle protein [Halomonas desiderata]MCE8012905.1 four helix bundle protein [Halomonas desiderata]
MSSITKHLPVYKTTYQLLALITKSLKHFSRDLRPALGNRLLNEVLKLITSIYRARATRDRRSRAKHLNAILETIEVVEPMLQLSHDMQCLPREVYAETVELTSSIARQVGGWLRDTQQADDNDLLHTG